MIPRDGQDRLGEPTDVVRDAHAVGLTVTGWTFRRENQFLPADYRSGTDPRTPGDLRGEIETFLAAGMDAFFTDHPDVGDLARRRHDVVSRGVRASAGPVLAVAAAG
jgi:glycerophosphoryl diester phosphodiesterase